jgi:chromosome segregation ATPase
MTAAVINELFEEGITRSRELSDAADEAMRAIDDMATGAEELAGRVDSEAAEARQHIRELVGRLERSESELEASGHQVEDVLMGLAGASEDLAKGAVSLLERVRKSLAELDTRHDQVEADLTTRMSAAQDDAADVAARTRAAQAAAEEDLQRVAQAVADFRSAIDTARGEFAHRYQAWAQAADDLESEAYTHADAWTSGLSDLLERQSTALVEAANSMVDEHNDAMDGLRARFVEQAPQHLQDELGPLESGLAELGQAVESREQELTAEAGRMAQWAVAAAPLVDALRTSLEAAARVE